MVALRILVPLLVPLLAPAWVWGEDADTNSDDGLSLLQMSKRLHSGAATVLPQRVVISPLSSAMTFVGRHDVVGNGDGGVVRFDAAGFEVQFRVRGTSEIKAAISQEINAPAGWYAAGDIRAEDQFEDACFLQPKGKTRLAEEIVHDRLGAGMFPAGSQPHHFMVYVDGVPQHEPTMRSKCHVCAFDTAEAIRGQVTEYTLARGLDPSKSHHIRLVKTSEPDFSSGPAPVPNWLALHSLILDQGFAQKPDPPRKRKIEFLGDSFMSGYCNTCKGTVCSGGLNNGSSLGGDPVDTYRWGSFALAWPHLLCEELQSECHATLLSGMGMHCNTHPDGQADCSADQTLPQYWQRTLASDIRTEWDFKTWLPDVFIIQVSGNDHAWDPVRDKSAIWATYEDFVDTVYEKYPAVHVVLVCGPYTPSWDQQSAAALYCPPIEMLVRRKKDSGALIDMLHLEKIAADTHVKDCCGHPDEDYHKLIKDKAVEGVTQFMGWT